MQASVSGQYTVYKNGELVGATNNMILDGWFDRFWGSATRNNGHMWCGSGTTAVTAADTGLETAIPASWLYVGTGTAQYNLYGADHYGDFNWVGNYPVGTFTGNVSEVGFRFFTSATEPVDGLTDSRALIRDVNGNPTTISIGASDVLVITFQFQMQLPAEHASAEVEIGGAKYKLTHSILNIASGFDWVVTTILRYTGNNANVDNTYMAAISHGWSKTGLPAANPVNNTGVPDFGSITGGIIRTDSFTGTGANTVMTRTQVWTMTAAQMTAGISSFAMSRDSGVPRERLGQMLTFTPIVTDTVGRTITTSFSTRFVRGMQISSTDTGALTAVSFNNSITEAAIPVGAYTSRGNVTATASGGKIPYTYSWALQGASGTPALAADTPLVRTTTFTATGASLNNSAETWRCTITDGNGSTATVDATVDLTWAA